MVRKTSFLIQLVKCPQIARQEKDQVCSSFAVTKHGHTISGVLAACQTLEMCVVRVRVEFLD